MDGRSWSGRQTGLRDVYVTRGWRPADRSFADAVCAGLCARRWRLRLVGDTTDQASFSADRIGGILSACCGHVVVLPRRGSGGVPAEHDYRYLIREVAISRELGLPAVLLAEADTALPDLLARSVSRLATGEDAGASWTCEPPEWPLPVFLTAQCAPDAQDRTARLPFMFRDSQITWYSSEAQLLGQLRRLLLPYRRRVMNYEFAKPT